MKTLLFSMCAAMALTVMAPACSADVSVEVDITYFHERLSPHGEWVEVEGHGWCWYPEHIEVGWRPYTYGHWVYVDDSGWYWHSDYDWGWACFHYGRWTMYGERWVWVPGYEWSGAWVAWRHGGAYVGWAPLPPAAVWTVGVGISTTGFSYETDITHTSWVFVQESRFTSTSIHTVAVSTSEVNVVLGKTKVLGGVGAKGNVAVNTALKVETIKPAAGEIKHVKLRDAETLGAAKVKGDSDSEIRVFRPKVEKKDVGSPKADRSEGARKTMKERQDAEQGDMKRRHDRDGKGEDAERRNGKEREDMEKRHKKERDDIEKRYPQKGDDDPGKKGDRPSGRDEPGKGDRPGSGRDEPGRDSPPKGDDPSGRDKPPKRDEPGRDKPPKGDDPSGRDKPPKRDDPGRDKPPKREEPEDPQPPRKDDPDPPKRDKPPKRDRD
jgi:hypothetical protein